MSVTLLAMALGQAAVPAGTAEAACKYSSKDAGKTGFIDAPDLHVLAQTAGPGAFTADLPQGSAILCIRSDIVPAANDWKVLAAGHPLYIVVVEPTGNRLMVLEIVGGQLRVSMKQGTLTEADKPRVQARLNEMQPFFYRK